ncbi:hypothetical protein N7495_008227 [Penicillium taxi]|uniref:uncharacterized protein n=1 Tax=Penicillium taxi TaxID=168475 RepID=UPI002544E8C9|nr:uncharacterized protein N7495_008227 [Penicillium taxi]KAJ5888186.1 hypothetical protein N7495_008227 [Penicillium taxi]
MAPVTAQTNPSSKLPSSAFAGARPYRSHKVRACDLCRKRKSRCIVETLGQSCLMCRMQGADCHYQDEANADVSVLSTLESNSVVNMSGQKRKRNNSPDKLSNSESHIPAHITSHQLTSGPSPQGTNSSSGRRGSDSRRKGYDDDRHNESVLIVGPMVAEDAQVIEKHMPPERSSLSEEPQSHPYNIYSSDPRKPVLYTTIPRRRKGMRVGVPPGENQKEILEQILGPFKHDLVKLFIDRFNIAFPIFDGQAFWEGYITDSSDDPPAALVCQVYSMSLVYWKHTPKLACHPKPDVRYAVNMTVAALHEEFSEPGLSTISAALIDLTGRPIFSMTGNAISCGRMISLANCLGLNRDPSNWKLSQPEMDQRIRLWWGVVIHDRWGSFGHGVPPQISKSQYDVPLPTVDSLVAPNMRNTERVEAAQCHIALCKLTEILGELLPLVYGLQAKLAREISKKVRQIRTDLDLWEDSLPSWLRSPVPNCGEQITATSSLQLAFLAVKMLVSRVELNEVNNADTDNPAARRYFQTECRRSAEDIVRFITSLRKENFKEFWLPYSAFHLTSTATLLVRCALESNENEIAQSCLANVETLRSVLRRVREEEDWDVADMCLDHCERIMHRLSGTNTKTDQALNSSSMEHGLINPALISLPETQTNNDIVDDMMSISNTFGTMDGFPFDMTGIWDVSAWE